MPWVTVIWSMIAAVCLTLAAIYGLVWYRDRTAWSHLLFSLTAVSAAAFSFCELWMMRAETPGELLTVLRWGHVPLSFWIVSTTWFVWIYLAAGRRWLAWTISALRAFYLLLNFIVEPSINYREVPRLRHLEFLGASITVPEGVANPLTLIGHGAGLLLLLFVADASLTVWRRGDHRKALMVGGGIEFFVLFGTAEGALRSWAGVELPVVFGPLYLGIVAVMAYELSHDVLRASQLVHELRESEARLSLAVDAAEFGLWIRELARTEIWANEKWRRLFGFALSERVEFDAILKRVHDDDRERLQQAQAMALAGAGGGRYQMEYRLILPDGATRWISSQSRVEFDAAGQPVLMRGASRDVTARKQSEEETVLLRQEIAHAGRISMMGQLAASLAHEINQPLGSILRNAEAAELFLQYESPDLDEIRAILADIRADDERAGSVIDRMRGLLKRHALDKRQLDLHALVREVAALVRVDAATRNVKLDVDVPGDLPHVQGDRVHLQQVLLNLILNGMDALNGASPEHRRIRVAVRRDAQIVEIAVSDAGSGIPAATLAHIFEPFFTTKPNGMGMGLAISRTIIEAHGGRLWAENKVDGGAAFRFTLPMAEGAGPQ